MKMLQKERIKFLVNPLSGDRKKHRVVDSIEQILTSKGLASLEDYSIEFTDPDNLENQVISACKDYEKIVAVGGDGTVGQVIAGILQSNTKRKLGIIPLGTANDLSRTLGIYREFRQGGLNKLLNIILEGKTKDLDLLILNDRFVFSNYFSLGIDAKISRDFNLLRHRIPKWGGRINKLFYIYSGLKNLRYGEAKGLSITIDGSRERINLQSVRSIIISNIRDYAGGSLISKKAKNSDGKFEVTIVESLTDFIILIVSRFLPLKRGFAQYQANQVRIEGNPRGYFQMDGEDCSRRLSGENIFEVKVYSTMAVLC
ncbi:hypothetical protein KJ693_06330 [bacterium]|nr:hypothetical protein [bacterium]MBU1614916.1 hypothetical protein [bacterium]